MEDKVKRPVSVWIAQVLLLILAVLFLLPSLSSAVSIGPGPTSFGMLAVMLIGLTISALSIVSFFGMMKRKNYGRWVGVVILSLMPVMSIIGQIRDKGSLYFEYENSAQWVGGMTANVLFYGLFLWLILHLALSKNVRAFFSSQRQIAPSGPPPPPPTFDD